MAELNFEEWYELNEKEINIELAENGADREMDFDYLKEFGDRYQKYIESKDVMCECTPSCEHMPAYECDYCKDICEDLEK